jgi:hypothetical protein
VWCSNQIHYFELQHLNKNLIFGNFWKILDMLLKEWSHLGYYLHFGGVKTAGTASCQHWQTADGKYRRWNSTDL